MSMVLDPLPRSRSTDPITSVDAGRSVDLNKSQLLVLGLAKAVPQFTQQDMERWTRDIMSPSRARSAVSELVAKEKICVVEGEFKKTWSGRKARVYEAVA